MMTVLKMDPERAEVVAQHLCVSLCELVRYSTWTTSAQSHWNITSSITPSCCPSTAAAKALWSSIPESQRPQHHVWGWVTLEPLASTCTCGLQRFLRETITWSQLTEQNPALPLGWGLLMRWGWVSFRVQCESQKSCTPRCLLYHIHLKGNWMHQ